MKERYLEVTSRGGKPIAGYLHLPHASGLKNARTEEMVPGLLMDFTGDGQPIGLEVTAPGKVTIEDINAALTGLGLEPVAREEVAPLLAA
jgi:hypothetical protein